ncbi:efflux RND transporter periplasmic adaptor subunit [Acidiluteibacter ferrifornacis]|uniref:Efflux RND transporter periplasmic adaptor subunit n=1 Tax=Acidiluteibacter ferrifornacis TaxID=2692424 RepID=A0A6N9NIS9_9FLAO|nr:efflux RND transporter periplasmic adaptor subunit [Acidiluteibacter ferrifornacis]NBG64565.1 efflux RND transporter periplasmic adaptor subunit [Acidiluteibacter ferrifornacis]
MKQYISLTALFICITFLTACNSSTGESTSEDTSEESTEIVVTKAQFDYNQMELGKLEMQSFATTVQTTGTIDVPPQNKVIVNAKMGGFVQSTPLLLGNYVEKGATLVIIENPEFIKIQQQYLEHKQQLSYLESEYNRQKTLNTEQISSEKNFLKAESDYKSTLATVKGLEKTLGLIGISTASLTEDNISSSARITAPISGTISALNITTGSYVSATDPILEITNSDHMHLELEVFEKDALKIKKGQHLSFTIPESGNTAFPAEVHLVSNTIDANKRTVRVHAHINDSLHQLFAVGMYVNAQIHIVEKEALALPASAVTEVNDHYYVLELINKNEDQFTFKKTEVKVIESNATYTFIQLEQNENQYLIDGAYSIIKDKE